METPEDWFVPTRLASLSALEAVLTENRPPHFALGEAVAPVMERFEGEVPYERVLHEAAWALLGWLAAALKRGEVDGGLEFVELLRRQYMGVTKNPDAREVI
ncbi:hypothetical protein [Streptomyces katrae]|nr:hypothetical protein [Streptomyces katrae]